MKRSNVRTVLPAGLALTLLAACGGGGGGGSDAAVAQDTFYADQWHLENSGQFSGTTPGEDINISALWNAGAKGQGVRVVVVDDGLQLAHEDLAANVLPGKSWDYSGQDTDPTPTADNFHGTQVAGVIAARDQNGIGVRGVAPRAGLAGYNLLWNPSSVPTTNIQDAMTRNAAEVDVSNNSWGMAVDGLGEAEPPLDTLWHEGIEEGIRVGRGGKGTIYVWASGNGRLDGGQDNSNYDYQANNRHVIAVCAVDGDGKQATYAEPGANLWLCAPGGDYVKVGNELYSLGLSTTDLMGAVGTNPGVSGDYDNRNYTRTFLGSSAAAPVVSGVVALMLEANPGLGWRDVRLILAKTARQNDPADSGWSTTVPAAGQPAYNINHKYGFGVVDAAAAVALAESWSSNVGDQRVAESGLNAAQAIPDNSSVGIEQSLTLTDDLIIEFVELDFTSNHPYPGDLEIVLTAPSGTQSILAEAHPCINAITGQPRFNKCEYKYAPWTFASSRHLGESSAGVWRLSVRDQGHLGLSGDLSSWTLRIYGRAP